MGWPVYIKKKKKEREREREREGKVAYLKGAKKL